MLKIILKLFIFQYYYNRTCVLDIMQITNYFNISSDTQTYLKFLNICLNKVLKYSEVYYGINKFTFVNAYYMQDLGLGPSHTDSLCLNIILIKINILNFEQNLLLKYNMFIENPIF